MTAYILKLGFKTCNINVKAQKIDSSTLKMFQIVLTSFQVKDKLGKARFFQKIFLLIDVSIEVILRMLFLILNNANIQFAKKKLTWKFYTIVKVLSTIKKIRIMNKKKFAKMALDKNIKGFVVYLTSFSLNKPTIIIHLARKAHIALFITKEMQILAKYSNFLDIFQKRKFWSYWR